MTRIEGNQSITLKDHELSESKNKTNPNLQNWYIPPDVEYPQSVVMPSKHKVKDKTNSTQTAETAGPAKLAQQTLSPTIAPTGQLQIADEAKAKQEAIEPTKPAQQILTRTQIFSIKAGANNKALVMKCKKQFRKEV